MSSKQQIVYLWIMFIVLVALWAALFWRISAADPSEHLQFVPSQEDNNVIMRWNSGPTTFSVYGDGGKQMVTIDLTTGAVEFGADYDLSETASIFWLALGHKMKECK